MKGVEHSFLQLPDKQYVIIQYALDPCCSMKYSKLAFSFDPLACEYAS